MVVQTPVKYSSIQFAICELISSQTNIKRWEHAYTGAHHSHALPGQNFEILWEERVQAVVLSIEVEFIADSSKQRIAEVASFVLKLEGSVMKPEWRRETRTFSSQPPCKKNPFVCNSSAFFLIVFMYSTWLAHTG
jgi:hypothetical protein